MFVFDHRPVPAAANLHAHRDRRQAEALAPTACAQPQALATQARHPRQAALRTARTSRVKQHLVHVAQAAGRDAQELHHLRSRRGREAECLTADLPKCQASDGLQGLGGCATKEASSSGVGPSVQTAAGCQLTSTMAPLMEPIQRNSRTLPPSRMYLRGSSGQKAGGLETGEAERGPGVAEQASRSGVCWADAHARMPPQGTLQQQPNESGARLTRAWWPRGTPAPRRGCPAA